MRLMRICYFINRNWNAVERLHFGYPVAERDRGLLVWLSAE